MIRPILIAAIVLITFCDVKADEPILTEYDYPQIVWNRGSWYRLDKTGTDAPMHSTNEAGAWCWSKPAGLHAAGDNLRAVTSNYIPGGEAAVEYGTRDLIRPMRKQDDGKLTFSRHGRAPGWVFPVGTIFQAVIQYHDGGSWHNFAVHRLTKTESEWTASSVDSVETAHTVRKVYEWPRDNGPGEARFATSPIMRVDVEFGVPKAGTAPHGYLRVDDQQCAKCHHFAGRTLGYYERRGDDRIFGWLPPKYRRLTFYPGLDDEDSDRWVSARPTRIEMMCQTQQHLGHFVNSPETWKYLEKLR